MKGEFINGDCMEYLKDYEDSHFDLAIVDPPYGIVEKSNRVNKGRSSKAHRRIYNQSIWDQGKPKKIYFDELKRVSKNQIIWGANYFESLSPFRGFIFWDKVVHNNNYSDGELAYVSCLNSAVKFTYTWSGMIQGDMKNKESRIHPTQKPIALYKWLLKNYAKDPCSKCDNGRVVDDDFTGETIPCEYCGGTTKQLILDTHVGSASSLIACEDMGFNYVGFEIDKDYYKAALKRLNNHIAQLKIF